MSKISQKLKSLGASALFVGKRSVTVQELEKLVGGPLPSDYVAFAGEWANGVEFEHLIEYKPIVPDPWIGKDKVQKLDHFYGLNRGKHSTIDAIDDYEGRMPRGLFPIASSPGGNQICLSTRTHDFGYVYFWDHDGEVDTNQQPRTNGENIYLAAKSFTDFLSVLTPADDSDDDDDDIGLESISLRF